MTCCSSWGMRPLTARDHGSTIKSGAWCYRRTRAGIWTFPARSTHGEGRSGTRCLHRRQMLGVCKTSMPAAGIPQAHYIIWCFPSHLNKLVAFVMRVHIAFALIILHTLISICSDNSSCNPRTTWSFCICPSRPNLSHTGPAQPWQRGDTEQLPTHVPHHSPQTTFTTSTCNRVPTLEHHITGAPYQVITYPY